MKKQTDTARVASPARVVPLAPYLGGKFRLSKRIIDKIEQIPHTIYAEPFVGMGGIFLRRKQIPKAEVINDINGELVNLYRIVRRYPDTLYKETEFLFAGRQEFERLLKTPPETLTDIERQDFETFIKHYDNKGTLFYIDPPYWGNEIDYGKGVFTRADFERLRDCLTGIKGRFILSLNDVQPIRDLFKDFTLESVPVTYSINNNGTKHTKELIISN